MGTKYRDRVADLQISPCIGCMSCREKLKCCLPEDDAQRVLKQIEEAQALIIGAPCYWGNLPGQLKVMFDRIVYGMMGETSRGIPIGLHKGKKGSYRKHLHYSISFQYIL